MDAGLRLLSAGTYHTCAVLVSGPLQCWGRNWYGQLGIGTFGSTSFSAVPVTVDVGGDVTAIANGAEHTCVGLANGELTCFGDNTAAQLGRPNLDIEMSPIPLLVKLDAKIALGPKVGKYNTCVTLVTGQLTCWGHKVWEAVDRISEVTDYVVREPTVVNVGGPLSHLEIGGYHMCGILNKTQSFFCFGWNNYGQLGDGSFIDRPSPISPKGLAAVVEEFSLGSEFSCAMLRGAGELRCWGDNKGGTMGDGTSYDDGQLYYAVHRGSPQAVQVPVPAGPDARGIPHTEPIGPGGDPSPGASDGGNGASNMGAVVLPAPVMAP
jgi:hypothetical protein